MTRRELLAASPAAPLAGQTQTIDQFFDSFTAEWMRANPESATSARFFPPAEQDLLDAKLSPPSAEEGPRRWPAQRLVSRRSASSMRRH